MKKIFNKKNNIIIITTFLVGLLIHIPLITKNIITADTLLNNYYYSSYTSELALGRFGLYLIGLFKSFLSFPEISLLLSLILISIINIYIIDYFDIKSTFFKIMISLLIVINPITSSILLFSHYSVPILLSILLSFISFHNLNNNKSKSIFKYIISGLLLFLTLIIYQPSISIFLSLLVFNTIKLIIKKKINYKELLYNFLVFIGSLVVYYIILFLFSLVYDVNSIALIHISTFKDLGRNFLRCYINFYQYFINNNIVKNTYLYNYIINIILFIVMIAGIVKSTIKAKLDIKNLCILILFILLIPLVFNISLLYSSKINMTLLLAISYLLFIPFVISLDNYNYSTIFIVLCMVLLFRNYFIQDRATYYTLENTFNKTNALLTDIYNKNTKQRPMMITGKLNSNKTINKITRLNYGFVANEELIKDNYDDRSNGIVRFYNYYLGLDVKYVDKKTYDKIIKSNKYKNMKKYSIIEDSYVVKLK